MSELKEIHDLEEIGERLGHIKRESQAGKYADVDDVFVAPAEDNLYIILELPNYKKMEFAIPIEEFWQDSTQLQNVLGWLDVTTEEFTEIENRRVPVKLDSNDNYVVDTAALQNGDIIKT